MPRTGTLMLIGILLMAAPPGHAAGIDCAKAKRPHDRAICADPALLQLDQDLAAAYDRLATVASEAGQAQIRRGEHARRVYIEELCQPTDKSCLTAAYRQSISSVTKYADQPTGAVLIPVERFRLSPAKTPGRSANTSLVTAFPRLDRPQTAWADGFAKAARQVAESLTPDDGDTDAVIDYRATYLAPDLAAVAFAVSTYPHGAAHGMTRQIAFNYLPAERRPLRSNDLFQSGTTWSGYLADRAFDGLSAQAAAGGWMLSVAGPGELEDIVADPSAWLIRADGLSLSFAPATVAAYVVGEREVLVPWVDIKPYLTAKPAFAVPTP